jgi:hypothetical protein
MPWFPEIQAAQARIAFDRAVERSTANKRLDFFDGILRRDPEHLAASFAGRPVVDDPRHGHVEGEQAFAAYVEAMRGWLDGEGGETEAIGLVRTGDRFVEEVSVKLRGDHPELPVAIVSDLAPDGRLRAVRTYHSLWPLTGGHQIRPPLLTPDPSIQLEGAPADYQRGLAAGDADAVVAAFEPNGVVREPSGGPFTYSGAEHRKIYDLMFANGGGIPLEFCTVTDDGTACAIEYNCVKSGKDSIPPQAGVAVYVRGRTGRLAAARIYDDVSPPESSDSSAVNT